MLQNIEMKWLEMDCQKNILNFLLCFYRIIIEFPVTNHIFVQNCTIAAPSPCSLHPQLDPTIQLNLTEGQGQDLVNQTLYFSNISWPINTGIADAAIGWVGILSACDHHSYIINELEIISNITYHSQILMQIFNWSFEFRFR